mmetsp:Transcript_16759/g.40072  ORF Transcript_16759/g.40072 Transcript_16759/m.40072 type:complete len:94 (+) Transcript_16759:75-356(+)
MSSQARFTSLFPSRRRCLIFLKHLIPIDGYMTIEKARNRAPRSTAGLEYTVSSVLHIDPSYASGAVMVSYSALSKSQHALQATIDMPQKKHSL